MIISFLFLFGLAIGSFISCLVYRLNHDLSLSGRSICDKCKYQLKWYDNIPLFSYLWLSGKCRKCYSPISIQYPLTEFATGILFVFVFRFLTIDSFFIVTLLHCYIVASLVALFISDLNYQTIPDIIIFPAIVLTLIYNLITNYPARIATQSVAGGQLLITNYLAVAIIVSGLFFLLSRIKIRGQQAMGFGDVELVFLMGLFLGFPKIIIALYLAFLTGAILGVILILNGKKKLQSVIPFGPFLIFGTMVAYFLGDRILKIFNMI